MNGPSELSIDSTTRLGAWRDMIRETFVALDITPGAGDRFTGEIRSTSLAHLLVSQVTSTPQGCTRTPELVARDGEHYLQVGLIADGEGYLAQDGREATLRPGDFAVYETDRPFFWGFSGDFRLLVFTWPRSTVLLDGRDSQAVTASTFTGGDGFSGVVSGTLRSLVEARPVLSPTGAVRVADEVAELVSTIAVERCGEISGEQVATGPLRRIEAYIAEHLDDPVLNPARIAAAHYMSTRQLHRLFARHGQTVSRYIRRQRLEHCRRDLVRRDLATMSITEICRRRGFGDIAAFSRAFHATYGVTPSRYRADARAMRDGVKVL